MDIDNSKILEESLKMHLFYKEKIAGNANINIGLLIEDVKKLYPYTATKLPSVINIAVGDSYDYNRLKFMLEMNTKVKNNEITEKEGSIQVGQVLVDDIVKPSLDKDSN
tara:strand:+ start:788 stop:1114 length:327 start_codon:yes stop_codon:yes gene_type:complete